jgi:hypothetical protein
MATCLGHEEFGRETLQIRHLTAGRAFACKEIADDCARQHDGTEPPIACSVWAAIKVSIIGAAAQAK